MQAPGSSSSSSGAEGEHEAVIRELTRGHELTAQLREEALRVLRGHGQAEATAALILQEVSRAFTVCLSIMTTSPSPARAPPPPTTVEIMPAALPARRSRDDSIPREQRRTSSPHHDGYQWRKYGQKRITKTQFPRCYFKCSFHRERNCRATKQVQQCSDDGDPPQYAVMYFNDHTCDTTAAAAWEPSSSAAAANSVTTTLEDHLMMSVSGGLARHGHGLLLDERGVLQEEHERQLLVSSLACVLGAQQHQFQHQQSPARSSGASAVAVNNVGHHAEQQQEPPQQRAGVVDAPGEMPRASIVGGVDDVAAGLDVTDYDVTGTLCFGDSYDVDDLPDDGFQF